MKLVRKLNKTLKLNANWCFPSLIESSSEIKIKTKSINSYQQSIGKQRNVSLLTLVALSFRFSTIALSEYWSCNLTFAVIVAVFIALAWVSLLMEALIVVVVWYIPMMNIDVSQVDSPNRLFPSLKRIPQLLTYI